MCDAKYEAYRQSRYGRLVTGSDGDAAFDAALHVRLRPCPKVATGPLIALPAACGALFRELGFTRQGREEWTFPSILAVETMSAVSALIRAN